MTIKMLVLDVDGVMTDGRMYYSGEGETLKAFNAKDGYGIRLLMKAGFEVGIISGRTSPPVVRRVQELGIRHVHLACKDKGRTMHQFAADTGIDLRQMAFVGDDLLDLPAIRLAGRTYAPADAVPEIRAIADHVTEAGGGAGAVREVCNILISEARYDIVELAEGVAGQ